MVGVDSGEGILEKSEIREIKNADLSIVISEAEREILSQRLPGAHIALVPLVRDFGPFEATPFACRQGLAFIGNYQHPPNVDAVLYFLDQIWPKIASELNDAEFHVVGSYVPSSIEERKSDRVKVHGFIEDLDALLAKQDWKAVTAYVHQQLPYVPLWYEGQFAATRQDIQHYAPKADGNWDDLASVVRVVH